MSLLQAKLSSHATAHGVCTTALSLDAPEALTKASPLAPSPSERVDRTASKRFRSLPAKNIERVLVTKFGASSNTTCSVPSVEYSRLLCFAYGDKSVLHAALRAAAIAVSKNATVATAKEQREALLAAGGLARRRQDFSALVRDKALKTLRGMYRPEKAAALALTSDEKLAEENNKAWEQPAP